MLNKISQVQEAKYHIFTHVESRPKIMVILIIMGLECKRRTVCVVGMRRSAVLAGGRRGKEERNEG